MVIRTVISEQPPKLASDSITIRGTVMKTVFSSEESGFTVVRIMSHGKVATVVGEGMQLHDGEEATFTGGWVDNPKFGRQFRAASFCPVTPDTLVGIRRFLASGLVKGVRESTADKLIEKFGEKVFEALERPADIARLPGIGKKRAQLMCDSYREHRSYRDLMVFLQTYGIGPGTAMRIHRRYGVLALDRVRKNPYRLAMEVSGIGFKTADRLALKLGVDPQSVERAQAGVLYVLEQATDAGHLYLPFEELLQRTEGELRTSSEAVASAIMHLDAHDLLVRDGDAIYLAELHEVEVRVALRLRTLAATPPRGQNLAPEMEWARQKLKLELHEEQAEAVREALQLGIVAITGGPGTGKTTLVRAVVAIARRLKLRFELCSPTGRAAKRLAEATGEGARTIHRLLGWSPEKGAFERSEEDPLDTDMVIVDESSMVDMVLMDRLLAAVPGGASLVLVGDADQLPSVGAGTMFRDVIESGQVPVVRLHHIHRQARGSLIVENAHRILHGEMPEAPPREEVSPGQDFFLVTEEDPARIVRMVKMLVSERIPVRFGFHPLHDVQVLSPMHRGLAGVGNLNSELQHLLNPKGMEIKVGEQRLRLGDKVMQLRNDYAKDIYNGDVGRIVDVRPEERALTLELDGRPIDYEGEELSDLQLAYASSVHKAQGSEYPAVVIVLAREHYVMCQRNLLYTAVTRGKALAVIVGSRSALRRAVSNDQVQRRYSRLAERLRASGPL